MRAGDGDFHGPLPSDAVQRKIAPLLITRSQLHNILRAARAQVQVKTGVDVVTDIAAVCQPTHGGDSIEQADKGDLALKICGQAELRLKGSADDEVGKVPGGGRATTESKNIQL